MIQVTTRGPFTLPGSSSHYSNHLVLYQSRRIRTRGWQFESPEGGSRSTMGEGFLAAAKCPRRPGRARGGKFDQIPKNLKKYPPCAICAGSAYETKSHFLDHNVYGLKHDSGKFRLPPLYIVNIPERARGILFFYRRFFPLFLSLFRWS